MKFSDATRYAVTLGKILGVAMIVFGFIFIDYFLIILVGFFVYIGASEEGEQTIISTNLAGVRVRDVMQKEVNWANPNQSLTEALEIMFKSRYHDLLVEKDGEFMGTVTWSELMKIDPEQRGSLRVEQMPLKKVTIGDDESILEANKLLLREKIDLLPVVHRSNSSKVIGVLTSGAIAGAYTHARDR